MYNTLALINAYIAYGKNVAIALGADPALAKEDMTEMVRFEREIAKVGTKLVALSNCLNHVQRACITR